MFVRWHVNDARRPALPQTYILHYAARVDVSRKYLLFQTPVFLKQHSLAPPLVDIWVGDKCAITQELYFMLADSAKALALARAVPRHCWDIQDSTPFISPEDFRACIETVGKVYLCIGSPGLGKTMLKLAPAVRHHATQGSHVILMSSLNTVRNTHVSVAYNSFPRALFEASVLCVGTCDLDALSRSRTLPALTWRAMAPHALEHEGFMGGLNGALQDYAVIAAIGRDPTFCVFATIIDSIGGFSLALSARHTHFAMIRVKLEHQLPIERCAILQRCHVIIGTIGGLGKETFLKQLEEMLTGDGLRAAKRKPYPRRIRHQN